MLKKMKVVTRLSLGFGLVIVLMLFVAFLSINRMAQLNDSLYRIEYEMWPRTVYANNIVDLVSVATQELRDMANPMITPNERRALMDNYQILGSQLTDNYRDFEALLVTDNGRRLLQDILRSRQDYVERHTHVMELLTAGRETEAQLYLLQSIRGSQQTYVAAIMEMIVYQGQLLDQEAESGLALYQQARMTLLLVLLVAAIVALLAAFIIARSLNRALGAEPDDLKDYALALSEGRLDVNFPRNVIENSVLDAVKQTSDGLNQMIRQIKEAVGSITSASSEIAKGNTDLSSRTEEQASSLEETASSMEELTATVRTNSDNARQANALTEQSSKLAGEGGRLIRDVVTTMEAINASSSKIADIIGVIDGIAFQTNILALNAAVEAARAGEQGRGFAVVASEVRTLAQRSANAAKDIKNLISDSVAKVTAGSDLVNQSGQSMNDIVTSIRKVNDIMAEIAAASVQQTTGIEEVSKAVVQMDEMTQQNAALVEEAAASAESLMAQANELTDRVATFRLADEQGMGKSKASVAPLHRPVSAPPAARATVKTPAKKVANAKTSSKPQDDEWESF